MVVFNFKNYGLFKTDRRDVFCKKCRELGINPETVKCEENMLKDINSKNKYNLVGISLDTHEELCFGQSDKPISKLKR